MQKIYLLGLFCLVVLNGLLIASSAIDPNKAVSIPVQPQPQNTLSVSVQQQALDQQQKLVEEKLNSFDKKADFLKWAVTSVLACMGFIITVVLAAVGFISWKSQKEYRESLNDVKDALKDAKEFAKKAEESCSHAEEWEKKSKQAFEGIDEQAKIRIDEFNEKMNSALNELDEKAKKHLKELFDEAQKQRVISEKWSEALKACSDKNYERADQLWAEIVKENPDKYFLYMVFINWGNTFSDWAEKLGGSEAEKRYIDACVKYQEATKIYPELFMAFYSWGNTLRALGDLLSGSSAKKYYHEACTKYQKTIELKPDYHDCFDRWGVALSQWARICGPEEAETLYREACAKYQKAIELNPSYYQAFSNWGFTFLNWAKFKGGQEKEKLYQETESLLLRAEEIKKGSGAYNMACLFALRGDEEKCKDWLKVGEEAKTLFTREYAMKDEDLALVRDKGWFKAIRWKGE